MTPQKNSGGLEDCWRDRTHSENKTYLVFFDQSEICEVHTSQTHFLVRFDADMRCFSSSETEGLQIKVSGDVLRLNFEYD